MYFTRINLGLEEFVILSGLYPVSKIDVIALLVKGAATALQTSKTNEGAFRRFIDPRGGFIRGDLFVFVLDDLGYCYAYGDQYHLIWKNLMGLKDDQGQQFVKLMIDQARNGATYLTFTRQKETYVSYVQRVEKNGVGFTIGSGFYK
jgi:signal transduction histidine kinase